MVVCSVRKELMANEKRLDVLREMFMRNTALGDSTATAEMLLFEHNKLQPDCQVSQIFYEMIWSYFGFLILMFFGFHGIISWM